MKIAVVGPESTGKSALCKKLALYYNGLWVPEFARYFLLTQSNSYTYADLEKIAIGQLFWEKLYEGCNQNSWLFYDTTLLTIKIWSEWKYSKTAKLIEDNYCNPKYDLILLSDVDLPWTYDPQRENPHDRKELFDYHIEILKKCNFTFEIVSGFGQKRLENAIKILENLKADAFH